MQDENKEGGKTSQLPVSGIGKGLALGNVLKFGFRVFGLGLCRKRLSLSLS